MKKLALITGAAKGIGFAIAQALAEQGIDLILNDILPKDKVEKQLEKLKTQCHIIYCPGDISQPGIRKKMIDIVSSHTSQLNFLINNAGIAPRNRQDILNATEESFTEVLSVNLQAPYFLTQAIANLMIRRQTDEFRCIINIGSSNAVAASIHRGEYCISKAGLAMATQLWAVRLAEFHIPVYEIRPGVIQTDMTLAVKEKYDRLIADDFLLQKRWGTPEDVAKAVSMLVKGELGYSTGQIINIDGGRIIDRF